MVTPVTDSELSRTYNQLSSSRRQTMITNSQSTRPSHTQSTSPRVTEQQLSNTKPATRLVLKKKLRHRIHGREMSPNRTDNTPVSGTLSRFLLTKASVGFDQSRPANMTSSQQPFVPSKSFEQAANGYAQCLYQKLLHNRNDSSNYSLGDARRLAEATKALSQKY